MFVLLIAARIFVTNNKIQPCVINMNKKLNEIEDYTQILAINFGFEIERPKSYGRSLSL